MHHVGRCSLHSIHTSWCYMHAFSRLQSKRFPRQTRNLQNVLLQTLNKFIVNAMPNIHYWNEKKKGKTMKKTKEDTKTFKIVAVAVEI